MSSLLRRYASLVAVACLTACGGSDSGSPTETVQQALGQIENNGTAPKLDRTTSVPGTDANRDGVRDDVEAYVASLSDTAEQKTSLLALSKAMGAALTASATDQAALRTATDLMNNAVACIWQRYPAASASEKVQEMRKVTVNTRERFDAYMAYNAAVAGTVVTLPREVNCG